MKYIKLIKNGIKNLTINKLRTGLAMLGIIIGIASVIVLMSLGESSQQAVQAQIQGIGSNLLIISPGTRTSGLVQSAAGSATTLTIEDADAIITSTSVTTIKNISPEYTNRAQVVFGRYNINTQIIGATPAYTEIRNIELTSGTFFTETENKSLSRVAIIGPSVASNLFEKTSTDPINQKIRINGQTFQVIGITKSKGVNGSRNQDDVIIIPLNTAQKQLFGAKFLSSIAVEVKNETSIRLAQNQIETVLLNHHKITNADKADFSVQSQQDILDTAAEISSTFSGMLTSIAVISLLVGGIGIMNIMLMIVTERTQEIGLRKALGATKEMIITQFLIESIVLTVIGGCIGILVGITGFYIYTLLTSTLFIISIISIAISFIVSMGIGVLFGWYPAKKAADLQPIDALRYE